MDLNQVTLSVPDFEAAVRFYETLGLRLIVSQRGEYARFEAPHGSSTLSIQKPGLGSSNGTTVYFEVEDLERTFRALAERGIAFDDRPKAQPWLWNEVHLRDPGGNRLCFYHAGRNRRFPPWRIDGGEGPD